MEIECSLQSSQQPATFVSSELEESSPSFPILFLQYPLLIILSHLCLEHQSGLFPSDYFSTSNPACSLLLISHVRALSHAHLIFLYVNTRMLFDEGTWTEARQYAVLFSLLPFPPSYAQISSSAPYSQTPRVSAHALIRQTKVHSV